MKKRIINSLLLTLSVLLTFSFQTIEAQDSSCKTKTETSSVTPSGSNVATAAVKNCDTKDTSSANSDPKACTTEEKAKCASKGKSCGTKASSCGSKASADASKAACGSKASADATKAECGSKASTDATKAGCSGNKSSSAETGYLNEESFMNRVMLLDSDSDGRVSKAEYMAHYIAEFEKTAKNDEGMASISEFAMLDSQLDSETDHISMEDFTKGHESLFSSLDKNFDGFIDGIDVRLGIIDSREAAASKSDSAKKSGCSSEQKAKCGQSSASSDTNAPAAKKACCSRH